MSAKAILAENLLEHLDLVIPNHKFSDIYRYTVLPPGKLFRSQLVYSIAKDFSALSTKEILDVKSPHALLASALEIHHAYTLIHDDLPCMDDDDIRRGKPSTHKQFGEWQALLAGDGLLNASYQLIAKTNSQNLAGILKFTTWALGAKGLIQGQVLDLSEEMKLSFDSLIETHRLKTARLIQTSLIASYLLTVKQPNFRTTLDLFKLGDRIGVTFQLLDDLTELADEKLSAREKKINPWFNFKEETESTLNHNLKNYSEIVESYNLQTVDMTMNSYVEKILAILNNNRKMITDHLPEINLDNIIQNLKN